mmetsp:Transcript_41751/g.54998  ORF Transcript_41751/g.54998 Transcript_41751/m.54998 type:complete len:113 (+) Transcript_41751:998-1336(+)|eukprot:CAMPEP_0185621288 /NCGR_PEP_ID=MMETSP0436-20130131/56798_1 /TAXON_ID=626734 ORGANISM="Favella taraikaensis, Strain Fe Narragansett Bay" /NCGR_SAMPLE_ID=MMETSP0436 /ASSEMBLY_ACC=CAM_ASM_000390 /LENGTH=112 /DNA_ID=CAMNT_0028262395 /DNA_START=325 /DNA_END=663 /DNA_ORIENTATION=+
MANFEPFFSFLKEARNLQVVRLSKTWRPEIEKVLSEETSMIYTMLVESLAESQSAGCFQAIQIMLPTYMTWPTGLRFNKVMPSLTQFHIQCLGAVTADDKAEIDTFIAMYDS